MFYFLFDDDTTEPIGINGIELDDFKKHLKKERSNRIKKSFDRLYDIFIKLELDKKNENYFFENASSIVTTLREQCWEEYNREEKKYTSNMLTYLIPKELPDSLKPAKAITAFVETYPNHLYELCLSNTNSRRSNAGKEFEQILMLIFMGAGLPIDTQGYIGKQTFEKKGLGKLVDNVCPGVTEFTINKRNAVLISAKTTLRERWQEVPEEMGRTGVSEMFLATLDETVSENVLNTLYESNIQLTTTMSNKEKNYNNNVRILSFEELLALCNEKYNYWKSYNYNNENKAEKKANLETQLEKNIQYPFVANYYRKRIEDLT